MSRVRASPYERAIELVPRLRERAREAESMRHLPAETISELASTGLFEVLAPTRFGGLGLGLRDFLTISRVVAQGCTSTAWTLSFLMEHNWMVARMPIDAQIEAFGSSSHVLATGTLGPNGRALGVAGGYVLNGRWPYASGIMHADWALLGAVETGSEGPEHLVVLVPVTELDVLDTWHSSGMRGTGSHDVVATDVFVPVHRTVQRELFISENNPGAAVHAEPYVAYPLVSPLALQPGAIALGAAEYALEVFKARAPTRPIPYTPAGTRQVDYPLSQERYARALQYIRLGNLLLDAAIELIDSTILTGQRLSVEQRAQIRLDGAQLTLLARDAVSCLCDASGTSSTYLDNPLQRIQRDVETIKSHGLVYWDAAAPAAGRVLLGREPLPADLF